jgi:DtxR family Mn-dependent transcriptional regulator
VLDQSSEFLRYLSETGLPLGTEGEVIANRPEAGLVSIAAPTQPLSLGREAAEKILVVPLEHP